MEFTAAQVATHTSKTDVWMSIEKKVYNVTKFLDEHPGEQAGMDATEAYIEIGHSDDARGLLNTMFVGALKDAPIDLAAKVSVVKEVSHSRLSTIPPSNINGSLLALVPLVAIIAFLIFKYFN